MPAPQTNGAADQTYDFAPVDFDINHVPPRINAGRYQAVAACSSKPTNKDKAPMLVVEWTMEAVADGNTDNEQFVGASVTDYIVLRGEGDPNGRMSKIKLRGLLERIGLSFDMVPRTIQSKADLQELCDAISGQHLDIGVSVRTKDQTGETRENIDYRAPRGESTDDVDAAPAAPRGRAAAPAKGPAGKGGKAAAPAKRR